MIIRSIAVVACAPAGLMAAFPAAAACALSGQPIPVKMFGVPGAAPGSPMVDVKVNGKPAHFLLNSSAAVSTISAKFAASQKLASSQVAGQEVVTVPKFELNGAALNNEPFVKVEQVNAGADGVLGQTLLHRMDVEYDLAGGKVILAKADGCDTSNMAYWAKDNDLISVMPLKPPEHDAPFTEVVILVNGVKLTALLDTAAPNSVITQAAAEKAGVKTTDAGVKALRAEPGHWRGEFTVNVGGEEVKNAPLEIAQTKDAYYDVLIGADYFKTHHLYVAYGQKKIYATRAGLPNAPVFVVSEAPPPGMDNSPESRGRLLSPAGQEHAF